MVRLLAAFALILTACGLAEGTEDEENKYSYITFTDSAFGAFCVASYDLNGDGRISRYEAQRILEMDCSARSISSLWDIREFTRLETLVCRANNLGAVDLRVCQSLRRVDLSNSGVSHLDVRGLSGLSTLNYSSNSLTQIDLSTCTSLSLIDCSDNNFSTLDVSACANPMSIDARGNANFSTLYIRSAQSVSCQASTSFTTEQR